MRRKNLRRRPRKTKRYATEFKAYLEATDPAGTLRKKYEHLIPKKPFTAYFLFSQDTAQREKALEALKEAGEETGIKHVATKLGAMWKAAAADVKAPFEEAAKKAHADFLEKQKEWQATPEFAEIEQAASKQAEKAAEDGEKDQTPVKGTKRSKSVSQSVASMLQATPAKRAKKTAEEKKSDVAIDPDVLQESGKLGLEGMLRNLAGRPEVLASGKTSRQIFAALQASGGLVNVAKRALTEVAGGAGA